MKPELVDKLACNYPTVFKNLGGDPRQTCMAWGIECGDGWYDIIDELCKVLEPKGVIAEQIKEKFGTLRFYVGPADDEAWFAIEEAEAKSAHVCESCGGQARTRGGSWLKTQCDACNERRENND